MARALNSQPRARASAAPWPGRPTGRTSPSRPGTDSCSGARVERAGSSRSHRAPAVRSSASPRMDECSSRRTTATSAPDSKGERSTCRAGDLITERSNGLVTDAPSGVSESSLATRDMLAIQRTGLHGSPRNAVVVRKVTRMRGRRQCCAWSSFRMARRSRRQSRHPHAGSRHPGEPSRRRRRPLVRFPTASSTTTSPSSARSGRTFRPSRVRLSLEDFRLRQSRRGIRAPPAWNEARAAAHASRAATGSRALVRAPSGGLARCARPATIRRATVARRTHRSRPATRSQPDAYLPRARTHAVRRSTTVCRGTQPCPRTSSRRSSVAW